MTEAHPATGTPDEQYDLVSVLYHALQGGEPGQGYIDDARTAGDDELATFFEQVQAEDRDGAEGAKQLLTRAPSGATFGYLDWHWRARSQTCEWRSSSASAGGWTTNTATAPQLPRVATSTALIVWSRFSA